MQGRIRSLLGITAGAVSQRRVLRALQLVAPGYASMPVENPILIYGFVFRPALCRYCNWDQIITDHEREFNLVIFVQQFLTVYRNDKSCESYKQIRSTKNYVAERFWREVNIRINYPLNRPMNHILENEDLDISDELLKFCFSWVMLYSSVDAVNHLLNSCNRHRMPNPAGYVLIKNMLVTTRTPKVNDPLIPTTPEAVKMYEDNGGVLPRNAEFGYDPLMHRKDL